MKVIPVADFVSDVVLLDRRAVENYAKATGDDNPLHLSPEYAAKTRFRKPIVHGGILFGLISRVLGTAFPGRGTVYVSQVLNFRHPAYVGDSVRVSVTLLESLPDMGARLRTEITSGDGTVIANGEATVKLPQWCWKERS